MTRQWIKTETSGPLTRTSLSCPIPKSDLAVVFGILVLAGHYLAELDSLCHAYEYGWVCRGITLWRGVQRRRSCSGVEPALTHLSAGARHFSAFHPHQTPKICRG